MHWRDQQLQIMPLGHQKVFHASISNTSLNNDVQALSHLGVHLQMLLSNPTWKTTVKYTSLSLLTRSFSTHIKSKFLLEKASSGSSYRGSFTENKKGKAPTHNTN
jgi:hypothetical protein